MYQLRKCSIIIHKIIAAIIQFMMHDIIRHYNNNNRSSSCSIENESTPKQSLNCLFGWPLLLVGHKSAI